MLKSVDPCSPGRIPLSQARLLQGALDLADAGGIGSLTIRSLPRELGAKPMSVYYHVANTWPCSLWPLRSGSCDLLTPPTKPHRKEDL